MAVRAAAEGSSPRKKTRHSPKGDARRRVILDTAIRMFAEGGYNTVSLAHIAEEVGITQAGLLHHFPTKSDLLMAAIEDRDERLRLTSTDNALADLLTILRVNEETPVLVKLHAVINGEALLEGHPAHDRIRQTYAHAVRTYEPGVEELIDPDKLPAGVTAHDLSRLLLATNEGVRWEWVIEGQAFHRSDRMAMMLELLRPYYRDPDLVAPGASALSE